MKNNSFSDYQLAPQWGLTDNSIPVQELTVGAGGWGRAAGKELRFQERTAGRASLKREGPQV